MTTLLFTTYLLLLGGVSCSPLISISKGQENDRLKVFNGSYTDIKNYPWAASFLVENNIWGAGAILNKNWILTTAFNCLWVDPSFITVRVGSSNWTQDGTVFQTEKCINHENYTGTWEYNIALLKVQGSIGIGSATIKKIGIPIKPWSADTTYAVTGWGVRSSSYQKETLLQFANQTAISEEDCKSRFNVNGSTYFCAFNAEAGPCVFDYGAPLVSYAKTIGNVKLFGLYVGSNNCTEPATNPALYVDVKKFAEWIATTMANN